MTPEYERVLGNVQATVENLNSWMEKLDRKIDTLIQEGCPVGRAYTKELQELKERQASRSQMVLSAIFGGSMISGLIELFRWFKP